MATFHTTDAGTRKAYPALEANVRRTLKGKAAASKLSDALPDALHDEERCRGMKALVQFGEERGYRTDVGRRVYRLRISSRCNAPLPSVQTGRWAQQFESLRNSRSRAHLLTGSYDVGLTRQCRLRRDRATRRGRRHIDALSQAIRCAKHFQ